MYKEVKEVETGCEEILQGYAFTLTPNTVRICKKEPSPFSYEPMIVRATRSIIADKSWGCTQINSYNVRFSEEIKEKTPEEIGTILPRPNMKESRGVGFLISRPQDKGVKTLETLNIHDKGSLGELATTLTMLSFGYTQHPSKYGGDNGLDGIFESWSKQYLWLTQAKQETKQRTALNIMENFLNENKIWDTLQEMKRLGDAEVKTAATLIESYIQDKSQNTYKLAYRMMDKGMAQCQICSLNIQGFFRKGPKLFNAPLKDKTKVLQCIMSRLEATPEKQLALALNALALSSITREEALSLVMRTYDAQALESTQLERDPQKSPRLTVKKEEFQQTCSLSQSSLLLTDEQQDLTLCSSKITAGEQTQSPGDRKDPLVLSAHSKIFSRETQTSPPSAQRDPRKNPKEIYNRDNLFHFLGYLKKQRENDHTIAEKLKGIEGASRSSLRRLMGNKDYASTKDYEHIWDALKERYDENFQEWLLD